MMRHWQYLKYTLRHKWYVFIGCWQYGIIWRGIVHDWTKFLPSEWIPYARTFYKPDGTEYYQSSDAFAEAWMRHQHRNKHHWQYWLNADDTPIAQTNILVWDDGTASIIIDGVAHDWDGTLSVREPIPEVYRREMLADWHGAGKATGNPNIKARYLSSRHNILLHPDTRAWVEAELGLDDD